MQILDEKTGSFKLSGDFTLTNKTSLSDLQIYFGEEEFIKNENQYSSNLYYIKSQIEIDGLFFSFYFGIENLVAKKIMFEIETTPKPRIPWGNNRDIETAWIATQMNDTRNFDWDNNPNCEQYVIEKNWGCVGVQFDFKNGTYQSYLTYK